MVKHDRKDGDYELVENPEFDRDLESGLSYETSSTNTNQNDIFPQSLDSSDANTLRNKFDLIAGSPSRSTRSFSFKKFKKNKKLFILLGVFAIVWLGGTALYQSNSGSTVLDYYKSKVGSNGSAGAEADNQGAVTNDSENDSSSESNEDKSEAQTNDIYDDTENDESGSITTDIIDDGDKEENLDENESETGDDSGDKNEETNGASNELKEDEKTSEDEQNNKESESGSKPFIPNGGTSGSKKISMADIRSGRFYVYDTDVNFIEPPKSSDTDIIDEGLYFYPDGKGYLAEKSSQKGSKTTLIDDLNFKFEGNTYQIKTFVPNYDLTYAIVSTDVERLFRHSSNAHYWLYNIKEKTFSIISADSTSKKPEVLSFAYWSPNYNFVTFVRHNDIYIRSNDGKVNRVSEDGSEKIFNGRSDWVYEEEVLATDKALWWSPDEKFLVYLRTDDTKVPLYNIDYYVQNPKGGATKYPVSKQISYPKPGFDNPKVSLHSYSIDSSETATIKRDETSLGDDIVVYEVFFVGSDSLIIKETDRESNILDFRYYNPISKESKITYEVNAYESYQGWIEKFNDALVIPPSSTRESWGYVDTIVVKGYNHLAFFETPTSEKPRILTEGEWEVSQNDLAFDQEKNLVYFSANKRSSIDRHVYTVNLDNGEIKSVTDASKSGYYTTNFSPDAKYVSLNYDGPDTPSQKILQLDGSKELALLSNSAILDISKSQYAIPEKTYHRIKVDENEDGSPVELNVAEILPKNFDKTKKHPLLVHFYAGPGSQVVTSSFEVGFEEAVSSSLDAVVLYIEPRGTAGQGWKFRSWATKNIGYWEPRDIVKVSQLWIDGKDYIDPNRTAVWGWSYGGFTTLKTLEFDAGKTFKYGMAVAPVTNWLLYDSIYTERYMKKPENNEKGYEVSQITNVDNLKKVDRFLVMHGTADDNVHIQNTYSLLDLLNLGGAENYDVQVFPDSEHSIYFHNANPIVYDKLTSWLKDVFEGDYDKVGQK